MRPIDADMVNEVIIFDKDNENINVAAVREYCLKQKAFLDKFPTIEAIPVSELEALRYFLYENDLIFKKGLSKLNELIEKYEIKGYNENDDM
jgi:hypothetical protein